MNKKNFSKKYCLFFFLFFFITDQIKANDQKKCDSNLILKSTNFKLDNDYFNGTDNNYTNGISVELSSNNLDENFNESCLLKIFQPQISFLKFLDKKLFDNEINYSKNIYFRINQSMFTPENTKRSDLITDDRPYAGLLNFNIGLNKRFKDPVSSLQSLTTHQSTIGIIGPYSFTKSVQNNIHNFLNISESKGWGNQLKSEPAFMYTFEKKKKFDENLNTYKSGIAHDTIFIYGTKVGNIETSLMTGVEIRYGLNISNDFGIFSSKTGCHAASPDIKNKDVCTQENELFENNLLSIYGFILAEGKAVARDFSLDGNLLRKSHHVNRNPYQAKFSLGINSEIPVFKNKKLQLTAMQIIETKEFEEQRKNEKYISLNIGFVF